MATRIQLRRGNANSWLSSNPILSSGEVGIETDTNLIKIGDSSNTWANLAYFSPSIGSTSNLAEGANLYFTNTRAIGAFTQGSGIVIAANGLISSTALGGVTSVNGANGNVQLFYSSNTEPVTNTTGTFWYKPDEGNIFIKVNDGVANIWLEIDTPFFNTTSNTTDIAEGANLYFTNSRSIAALTSGYGINIDANGLITSLGLGGGGSGNITEVAGVTVGAVSNVQLANAISSTGLLTTANVSESGNLYFTNTRAISALSAGYGIEVAANGLLTATIASAAIGNVTGVAGVETGNVSNAQLSSALALQNVTVNNLTVTESVVGNFNVIGDITSTGNVTVSGEQTITGNLSTNNFTTNSLSVGNITVTGNIVPTVNEAFSLGTPSFKFKDLFLSGNTIVLGETLLKSDPALGGFTISSSNVEQPGSITFSIEANSVLISDIVTTNVITVDSITTNVITVDSITSNVWSGLYTANVVETAGNLYFTNTRAISALTAGRGIELAANGTITSLYNIESIAGVANGIVSNIQIAFAIQDTALLNTANIIEGGNLYYTNARVAANVATLGYAPNAYVNTRLLTKANVSDLTPLATNSHVTAVVNLLQTSKANNEDVTNLTTGNIPENETNLYFSNTRVVYALYTDDSLILDANGRLIANIAAVGGGTITSVAGVNFGGVSNVQLADALVDRTVSVANITVTETASINKLRVTGDMSVTGTTTFINTTEVAINDKNLVLANGAADASVAHGAGISISGAYANLTYYNLFDRFNFNKYVDVLGNTILTNANTTTHITEGNNLYFTNTRAVGAFTAAGGLSLASNGYIILNPTNVAVIATTSVVPAVIDLDVGLTNNNYNLGPYTGTNPDIKVFAGQTIAFDLGAGLGIANHPFTIKNTLSGTNVTSGLSIYFNNGSSSSNPSVVQGNVTGRLFWKVPPTLGGNTYVYQSTANAQVFGNIIIIPQQYISGIGTEVSANGLITNTGVITVAGANSDVSNAQLAVAVYDLINTSNIAEGSNLFYTNTRVQSFINDTNFEQLQANTSNVAYSNVSTLFNLGGTIFHPQGDNGFSVDKDIDIGNSSIRAFNFNTGTTHEKLVIGISHNDQFTHGIGAYGSSADSNLIIALGDSNADILFKKNVGIPFDVSGGTTLTTITRTGNIIPSGSFIGSLVGTVSSLSNFTTDNLSEGSSLYFTNSRAIGAFTAGPSITIAANGLISSTSTGSGNGDVLTVNGANGNVVLYHTSVTAPANATLGALWYNNVYGNLFVYVNDGTSNVWIEIDDSGAASNTYLTTSLLTKANVSDLTTANVVEVDNLYYTNTRVQAYLGNISGNIVPADTEIYSLGTPSKKFKDLFLSGNTIILGDTKIESSGDGTISIKSTNAEVTSSISFASNGLITSDAGVFTTANVAEQGNLYFTNARARAVIENGTGVFYNPANGYINIGQDVRPTSSVEFHDLLVTGNVTFAGNAAVINTTSLSVTDNMIYLNESKAELVSNVIGDGANVTYYLVTDHTALVGQMLSVTSVNPSSFNIPYTNIIAITANSITVSSNVIDTYVSGGNAFIKAAVNPDLGFSGGYNDGTYHHAGLFRDASDGLWKFFENYGPEPDSNVYIDTSHPTFRLANLQITNVIGNVTGRITSLDNHNTSNLAEGSNLYYTNDRVYANVTEIGFATNTYVNNSLHLKANVVDLLIKANVADLTTSNVIEGANLYFTNTRVVAALTAGTGIVVEANGLITSTALGGVQSVGGQSGNISNAQLACSIITSGVLNTSNVSEGSNLYFTNTRAVSALTAGTGISIAANGRLTVTVSGGGGGGGGGASTLDELNDVVLSSPAEGQILKYDGANWVNDVLTFTTANIAEEGNLYFTNSRVVSALSVGVGLILEANGFIHLDPPSGNIGEGGQGGGLYYTSNSSPSGAPLGSTWYKPDQGNIYVRVNDGTSNVWLEIDLPADISPADLTTANVIEVGSNVYFTNARTVAALTPGQGIAIAANGMISSTGGGGDVTSVNGANGNVILTTGDIAESGNLYFTNVRARQAFTAGDGISIAANGRITSTATGGGGGGGGISSLDRSFNFPGELSIQTGTARWYPQYSYTINTIRARVSNAPVGNDINLNIRKNGNVIATTTILDGLDRSSINTSIPVAYEDYITVDITSVGNAAKGTDLVVSILYSG